MFGLNRQAIIGILIGVALVFVWNRYIAARVTAAPPGSRDTG